LRFFTEEGLGLTVGLFFFDGGWVVLRRRQIQRIRVAENPCLKKRSIRRKTFGKKNVFFLSIWERKEKLYLEIK
jgi:hypothetical protein